MQSEVHERALNNLANARKLYPGETYMVDPQSGLVTCAMVWLQGGIAYFDHWSRSDPGYVDAYLRATHESRAYRTLFAEFQDAQ